MRACRASRSRRTAPRSASCGRAFSADFGNVGIPAAAPQKLARLLGDRDVAALDLVELGVLELLEVEQRVVPALAQADQLVELDLDRLGIPVLGALDQEHHE